MGENQEILTALNKLELSVSNQLGLLQSDFNVFSEKVNNTLISNAIIASDVRALDKIIRGNGIEEGLLSKVKEINVWKESRVWFERVVMGAFFVELIGLIFVAIDLFVTHPGMIK